MYGVYVGHAGISYCTTITDIPPLSSLLTSSSSLPPSLLHSSPPILLVLLFFGDLKESIKRLKICNVVDPLCAERDKKP